MYLYSADVIVETTARFLMLFCALKSLLYRFELSLILNLANLFFRYGIECLFRYYSYGLERKFKTELYRDFQEEAMRDYKSGKIYPKMIA